MNNLHQVPHRDRRDKDAFFDPWKPSKKLLVATRVGPLLGFAVPIASVSIALFAPQVGVSVAFMGFGIILAVTGFVVADGLSSVLYKKAPAISKAIAISGAVSFLVGLAILLNFVGVIDLVLSWFR